MLIVLFKLPVSLSSFSCLLDFENVFCVSYLFIILVCCSVGYLYLSYWFIRATHILWMLTCISHVYYNSFSHSFFFHCYLCAFFNQTKINILLDLVTVSMISDANVFLRKDFSYKYYVLYVLCNCYLNFLPTSMVLLFYLMYNLL